MRSLIKGGFLRLCCFLATVALIAACDGDTGTSPTTSWPKTMTITAKERRILVDATKGNGIWWCCPGRPHQGKALADHLRGRGFEVTELSDTRITSDMLAGSDVVIRAGEYYPGYSPSEIQAYHNYLADGGNLLLLSDYQRPGWRDTLAESFGIVFHGISRGENRLDRFEPHPITDGIFLPLSYIAGSGITELPPGAQILAYMSWGTYLDLNDNDRKEDNEPRGMPALGRMTFGQGEIVFGGDANLWLVLSQPLVDNTIYWLF